MMSVHNSGTYRRFRFANKMIALVLSDIVKMSALVGAFTGSWFVLKRHSVGAVGLGVGGCMVVFMIFFAFALPFIFIKRAILCAVENTQHINNNRKKSYAMIVNIGLFIALSFCVPLLSIFVIYNASDGILKFITVSYPNALAITFVAITFVIALHAILVALMMPVVCLLKNYCNKDTSEQNAIFKFFNGISYGVLGQYITFCKELSLSNVESESMPIKSINVDQGVDVAEVNL